ncbi:MAG: hypothetical protein GXO64_02680 [Candidatus Micrarchaeota archaeon]|nr:hypothetical protein [Candidatus Micrarchaeota archaeon]
MKKLKGQSAMEYLMTYGWAIIIVIIVAAALYALGVFNPSAYTTTAATGFSELGKPAAGSWQYKADGSFTVKLSNNLPYTINVTSLTVTTSGGSSCSSVQVNSAAVGASNIANGGAMTVTATCPTSSAGASYTVKLDLTYTNIDQSLTGFKDSGTVTGKVSE